jgi:hypothetical protein
LKKVRKIGSQKMASLLGAVRAWLLCGVAALFFESIFGVFSLQV